MSAEERPFEFFMNRLRLFEAVPIAEFTLRTGLPLEPLQAPLEQAVRQGLLRVEADHWHVTELGHRYLNQLLTLFLDT